RSPRSCSRNTMVRCRVIVRRSKPCRAWGARPRMSCSISPSASRPSPSTHVFRVSNRTGIAPGENVREVEDKLAKVVPVRFKLHAHHWLILHGRYICLARKPGCPECLINDLCQYQAKTMPEAAVAGGRARTRKTG